MFDFKYLDTHLCWGVLYKRDRGVSNTRFRIRDSICRREDKEQVKRTQQDKKVRARGTQDKCK